nr:hypothetical protein StreXyl84_69450 [Streptomyces sp. Xyl84]
MTGMERFLSRGGVRPAHRKDGRPRRHAGSRRTPRRGAPSTGRETVPADAGTRGARHTVRSRPVGLTQGNIVARADTVPPRLTACAPSPDCPAGAAAGRGRPHSTAMTGRHHRLPADLRGGHTESKENPDGHP